MFFRRLKLLVITSRPIFWLGPIFIYLLGTLTSNIPLNFAGWWGLFFVTFPMGLIVYGLNDIADKDSDKENKRKGCIEGGVINESEIPFLMTSVFSVIIISVSLYVFLGYIMSAAVALSIVVFAYLYSFEPIRLKSRPFLDSLTNALWMLLVFILGSSISQHYLSSPLFPSNIWFIVLGVYAVHALTTLLDLEVDKSVGDRTTGGFLGIKSTAILCCVLFSVIAIFLKVQNVFVSLYLGFCIMFCGSIVLVSNRRFIHFAVWLILLGFPLVCLLTFIFDGASPKIFLAN